MSLDKEPDDALVDHLRALWEQENEAPELPPLLLEETDETTRAAVGWLQSAWAVEAQGTESKPPVADALRPKPRLATKGRRHLVRPGLVALVTAAAAAALLVLAPRDAAQGPSAPRVPTSVDVAASPTEPIIFDAERVAPRSDGIELVTGNVRVVLVHPTR